MTNVHLVGSIALESPPEVYATAGKLLGPHLKHIPARIAVPIECEERFK